MTKKREKFSTQMDSDLLKELKYLAKSEGRQIQSIVEEAVEEYVAGNNGYKMHPALKKAYGRSIDRFDTLYEKLAK
ncbi:MAG: ribbon-helix-helix domain-containing protein [Robiginitomaculum sp.]|nr:ribbon-helix-helix domain-containing protein [Robiginitomaculum sp.]